MRNKAKFHVLVREERKPYDDIYLNQQYYSPSQSHIIARGPHITNLIPTQATKVLGRCSTRGRYWARIYFESFD